MVPAVVAFTLIWGVYHARVQAQVPAEAADSASSLIEFRIAQEVPAPGLQRLGSPVLAEGREIYVEKAAFLKAEGIRFASVAAQPGRLVIALEFTDEAASRLTEVTEANVGRQLAIFIGSRLVSSARIVEPPRSRHAQFTVKTASLPPGVPEEIVSRFAARWPRGK